MDGGAGRWASGGAIYLAKGGVIKYIDHGPLRLSSGPEGGNLTLWKYIGSLIFGVILLGPSWGYIKR
jgi:hypothetical protein